MLTDTQSRQLTMFSCATYMHPVVAYGTQECRCSSYYIEFFRVFAVFE